MFRALKTLLQDSLCWGLFFLLILTVAAGITTVFERYEKFDQYRQRLIRMEYDIALLHQELDQKNEWVQRLKSDPTAWEQVAREKMNYLRPDELLVTFAPASE
ncbi:MAG: hypothetical protein JXR73_17045 [Candidatus Omnitrophica bacterium]|nr:hypothetical protein [Candidatus Omnitrophota bacterium]